MNADTPDVKTYRTSVTTVDNLHRRSKQLDSLMNMLIGYGTENFQRMSPDSQDGILWLISDLSRKIRAAAVKL